MYNKVIGAAPEARSESGKCGAVLAGEDFTQLELIWQLIMISSWHSVEAKNDWGEYQDIYPLELLYTCIAKHSIYFWIKKMILSGTVRGTVILDSFTTK